MTTGTIERGGRPANILQAILSSDRAAVNPSLHLALLRETIKARGANVFSPDGMAYNWNSAMALEEARLAVQNSDTEIWPDSWGNTHRDKHIALSRSGIIQPGGRIAIIGSSGLKPRQTRDIASIYPQASKICLIEINPKKCEAAKKALELTHSEDKRIEVVFGDAAQELPRLSRKFGGFHLIDGQNVLVHVPEKAPLTWNPEEQGPFPTFELLMQGAEESLAEGGVFNAGELGILMWQALATTDDPQLLKTVARLNEIMKIIPQKAWTERNANAWEGPAHMREKYSQYTRHLKLISASEHKVAPTKITKGPGLVSMHIPVITAANYEFAARQNEEALASGKIKNPAIRAAVEQKIIPYLHSTAADLWDLSEEFIELAMQEGVLLELPPLYYNSYQKQSTLPQAA